MIIFFFILLSPNLYSQPFSYDSSFYANYNFYCAGSAAIVNDIFEEPDGSIMAAGGYNDLVGKWYNIVRFHENGQIDTSLNYDPPFIAALTHRWVQKLGNNYYFLAGSTTFGKMDHNGKRDSSWTFTLLWDISCDYGITFSLSDSSILVGGNKCSYPNINPQKDLYFMRILPNGKIDSNFNHNTNSIIISIIRYDSEKLLLCGSYLSLYDSIPVNRICRIDTLGNLDTSFKTIFTWGGPLALYTQTDGKIIVGGQFTIQNHPDTLCLIRLNPDGSLDSTFNNFNSVKPPPFGTWVSTVCPTSDGGYLIGGEFTQYQGHYRGRIAKTDSNGFLDLNYFNGTAIDDSVAHNILLQPYVKSIQRGINDKYYVMGYFIYFNGQPVQPIFRLNGPTTGITKKKSSQQLFKVYPNPCSGICTIEIERNNIANMYYEVCNILGNTILEGKIMSPRQKVDMSSLKNGIFIIIIKENGSQIFQHKIIINR